MASKKYETSGLVEAQFQSGSNRRVLKNLMNIQKKSEMDMVEAVALKQTEDLSFRTYAKDHRFTTQNLREMHKTWLGRIYPWAGNFRNVDLSK